MKLTYLLIYGLQIRNVNDAVSVLVNHCEGLAWNKKRHTL